MADLVLTRISAAVKNARGQKTGGEDAYEIVAEYDAGSGAVARVFTRGELGVLDKAGLSAVTVQFREGNRGAVLASGRSDSLSHISVPVSVHGKRIRFNAEDPLGRLDTEGNVRIVDLLVDPSEWGITLVPEKVR